MALYVALSPSTAIHALLSRRAYGLIMFVVVRYLTERRSPSNKCSLVRLSCLAYLYKGVFNWVLLLRLTWNGFVLYQFYRCLFSIFLLSSLSKKSFQRKSSSIEIPTFETEIKILNGKKCLPRFQKILLKFAKKNSRCGHILQKPSPINLFVWLRVRFK